jgi:hypothetical protein
MPKHLYLLILITFITGLVSGVYAFFMTRTTDTRVPESQLENGYEIIAYTYGGCERVGCSSFKLDDTGAYTYLTRSITRSNERFDDVISEQQREELGTLITDTSSLRRIEATLYSGTCPVTYDGIAYRFEIRVESDRYSFDSCRQMLEEEPFFVLLTRYFDSMHVTHRAS